MWQSGRWRVWLCMTGMRQGSLSRASDLVGEGLQLFERKTVVLVAGQVGQMVRVGQVGQVGRVERVERVGRG